MSKHKVHVFVGSLKVLLRSFDTRDWSVLLFILLESDFCFHMECLLYMFLMVFLFLVHLCLVLDDNA